LAGLAELQVGIGHEVLGVRLLGERRAGRVPRRVLAGGLHGRLVGADRVLPAPEDRKSTRLNSSHVSISYAVFCLKKKKNKHTAVTIAHALPYLHEFVSTSRSIE